MLMLGNLLRESWVVGHLAETAGGTILGVMTATITNVFSQEKINPLIGSAGIASVPIAARVSHLVAHQANPKNYLIYHAMGPNLAGVFGTAISGGIVLALLGMV